MRVFIAVVVATSPLAATAGPLPPIVQQSPQVQGAGSSASGGADVRHGYGAGGGTTGAGFSWTHAGGQDLGPPAMTNTGNLYLGPPAIWGSMVEHRPAPVPGPVMGTVIQPRPPYVGTSIVPAPSVFVMGTGMVQPGTIPLWYQGGFYPAPVPVPVPVPYWGSVVSSGGGGPVMGSVVNPGVQYLGTAVSPTPRFYGTSINPDAQYQGLGVNASR